MTTTSNSEPGITDEDFNQAATALVVHGKFVEALNLRDREAQPCRSYQRYMGKRSPRCLCLPCMRRFLEACIRRGKIVRLCDATMRELFLPKG